MEFTTRRATRDISGSGLRALEVGPAAFDPPPVATRVHECRS